MDNHETYDSPLRHTRGAKFNDILRDFIIYRVLGIADATAGKVIRQIVSANSAPEAGTGWHIHRVEFHGWAKFIYEDKETPFPAGDCVHQKPGIRQFDYSPDMEHLEIPPQASGSILPKVEENQLWASTRSGGCANTHGCFWRLQCKRLQGNGY